MDELVIDPTDSTKAVVMKGGRARLAATVFMAPVGADPLDRAAWTHIGFGDPDGVVSN